MRFLLVALAAITLAACKTDNGVKKGQFEQDCATLNGKFERISENEYQCALKNGDVLKSTPKK